MSRVTVETVLGGRPNGARHADPNQLELAILNLAVNSRDAMPNGGQDSPSKPRMCISTKNTISAAQIEVLPGAVCGCSL